MGATLKGKLNQSVVETREMNVGGSYLIWLRGLHQSFELFSWLYIYFGNSASQFHHQTASSIPLISIICTEKMFGTKVFNHSSDSTIKQMITTQNKTKQNNLKQFISSYINYKIIN